MIRVCAVTRVATNAAAQQGDTALETSGVMGSRLSDLCERACMSLSLSAALVDGRRIRVVLEVAADLCALLLRWEHRTERRGRAWLRGHFPYNAFTISRCAAGAHLF